jgi:hypothetical protein
MPIASDVPDTEDTKFPVSPPRSDGGLVENQHLVHFGQGRTGLQP